MRRAHRLEHGEKVGLRAGLNMHVVVQVDEPVARVDTGILLDGPDFEGANFAHMFKGPLLHIQRHIQRCEVDAIAELWEFIDPCPHVGIDDELDVKVRQRITGNANHLR